MRNYFRAIIIVVLTANAAPGSAQIINTAPQEQTLTLNLVCPMTANITPQDRNPPIFAQITGQATKTQILWLDVVYTLVDGRKVRRGDQYINTTLWISPSQDGGNIMWSGTYARDHTKTIVGQITGTTVLFYHERHFAGGVQESESVTPCVPASNTQATGTTSQPSEPLPSITCASARVINSGGRAECAQ